MRKNNAFVAKIVNTRWTKVVMVIFALAEMLPTSATLNTARFVVGVDSGIFCTNSYKNYFVVIPTMSATGKRV